MIFSFLRRRKRGEAIEPLYGAMMAAALKPELYAALGVPDTFEGRFESVTLHAGLVLRRLKALPPPADDMAQDFVDRTFDGLESAMREIGISDVAVPKRMKKFAQGFYGRIEAYTAALAPGASSEALGEALSRNLLDGAAAGEGLLAHVRCVAEGLERAGLDHLVRGQLAGSAPAGETGQ